MYCLHFILLGYLLLLFLPGRASGMQLIPNCPSKYTELHSEHTMCLVDNPNAQSVIIPQKEKQKIVDLHNELRSHVSPPAANMQKVVWDDVLAKTAAKWSMQCNIGHDENVARLVPEYGRFTFIHQNAGYVYPVTGNFTDVIQAWYDEVENFTFGGAFTRDTVHYFQVVFHGSSRIGCGQAKCTTPSQTFWFKACNYAAGLQTTAEPYSKGSWCSGCPNHCDKETKRLCDCGGKICYSDGVVDVSTCKCDCRKGYTGENCESIVCPKEDYLKNRCGKASRADCGVRIYPKNCPILCGLCPKPCGGKVCENNGKLNHETCKCKCPGVYTGDFCEKFECPLNDEKYCPHRSINFCNSSSAFASKCPYRCGLCTGKDSPCGSKRCLHHGTFDATTCKCKCKGLFTGDHCETCPRNDKWFCKTQPVSMCNERRSAFWMEKNCPNKCSYCN